MVQPGRRLDELGASRSTTRTNLVTNPTFETNAIGWAANTSATTLVRSRRAQHHGGHLVAAGRRPSPTRTNLRQVSRCTTQSPPG